MEKIITKSYRNPIIFNPVDHTVYEDSLSKLDDNYQYQTPILNAKRWVEGKGQSLAASETDPLRLTEVFYGEYADHANEWLTKLGSARKNNDRSLAAAIITSKEYTILQDAVVLGENEETIKTGILRSIFPEIAVPTLTGTWTSFANDVKYFTNIPESKSPEPTMGTASEVTIEVPKHGGAVAITDRARQVINGGEVFNRLVAQLQLRRLASENELTAEEIEATTSSNITGVDFGASGSGLSTNDPTVAWNNIFTIFDATPHEWNSIVSKPQVFLEYQNNTFVKGTTTANPGIGNSANEQSGPVPGVAGVTWYRDSFMDTLTEAYVFDRNNAIKMFRGPTRAYTVTDPDTETEKYVTKSHLLPKIVDQTALYRLTPVQA